MAIMLKNGKNVRCDNMLYKNFTVCFIALTATSKFLVAYLLVTKPSQMCYLTAISLFLLGQSH